MGPWPRGDGFYVVTLVTIYKDILGIWPRGVEFLVVILAIINKDILWICGHVVLDSSW